MDNLQQITDISIGVEQFIKTTTGDIEFVVIPKNDWMHILNIIQNLGVNIDKILKKEKMENDIWQHRLRAFRQLIDTNKKYDMTVSPDINISELTKEVNDVIL